MNFPFGVWLNLQDNIWLSPSVWTAQGLPGAFHSVVPLPLSTPPPPPPSCHATNRSLQAPLGYQPHHKGLHSPGAESPPCWGPGKCVMRDVITSSNENAQTCFPEIPLKSESLPAKPQQNSMLNGNLTYLALPQTSYETRENALWTESWATEWEGKPSFLWIQKGTCRLQREWLAGI